MRCYCCNRVLNDFESTRKDTHGNYLDICNKCFRDVEDVIPTVDRDDLNPFEESDDEFDLDGEYFSGEDNE